jgi:hypothetical protein
MQQTFTLNTHIQNQISKETELFRLLTEERFYEENPSDMSISNILQFSRNIETKTSEQIGFIDYLKS